MDRSDRRDRSGEDRVRESRDGKRSRRDRSRSRSRSRDRKSDRDRRSSKKHKHDNKRHRRSRDKDDNDDDSLSESSQSSSNSSASYLSSDSRRGRHSKKKHHRKEKKRKHSSKSDRHHKKSSKKKDKKKRKKKSRHRSRSRSASLSVDHSIQDEPAAPPGAHELAASLTDLFNSYPAMFSLDEGGIPLLLIKLSQGTEYDLSQMPDRNLARLLNGVFEALSIHGMELNANGAWKWANAVTSGRGGDDLALLRLARALLGGVGFTMDAVENYEREQVEKRQTELQQLQRRRKELAREEFQKQESINAPNISEEKSQSENEADIKHKKRVERMASQLLDRFDPQNSTEASSGLASELQGICDILLEGESVQLDGLENDKLRATLGQLFQLVGLELVEMEDDDEEDDEAGGEGVGVGKTEESQEESPKAMGYALPERADVRNIVSSYLNEVLRVCRFRSSDGKEGVPTSWAAKPSASSSANDHVEMESSSDEDEGPAPLGTMAAVKASKRQRPPKLRDPNNPSAQGGQDEGGREEWMMVPGEHDFLKGIQAGGSKSFRGRTFKNEKNRGLPIASNNPNSDAPIDPKVLAEVNAIQQAYEESRGPSLLDAHRQQQQEMKEKQQNQKSKEWKWSRDKNLDDGRRVDKNALHMVLGGASTELKNKFQGGVGR